MAKIMVVEDEAVIRQLIIEELEKWQFETFGTTDFHQVFDDFEEQEPQLIFVGHQFTGFDGYYWCQKNQRDIESTDYFYIKP